MHVDAPRHQHAAVGIYGFYPARHDEVFPNLSEEENMRNNKTKRKLTLHLFYNLFNKKTASRQQNIVNKSTVLIYCQIALWKQGQ